MTAGNLYLIPASLAPIAWESYLPPDVRSRAFSLEYLIVENAKATRSELKHIGFQGPIREVQIESLPEKPTKDDLNRLLQPVVDGRDCGLMSDAGCPGVADPGSQLVRAAHSSGLRAVPVAGPSSILLALMATGLNGQSFAFLGYLPIGDAAREEAIRALEQESLERQRSQIFIETPYRNDRLFASLIAACRPDTMLCVATDITAATESIVTRSIASWRNAPHPAIDKRPTVFLVQAADSAQPHLRQEIK